MRIPSNGPFLLTLFAPLLSIYFELFEKYPKVDLIYVLYIKYSRLLELHYQNNDLKSTEHVKSISSKAHRVLSSLKRSVTYRGKVFIELYKTYVRPIVEASAVVWNPAKESDIKKIEGVQRRALRCVKGFKELSYTERFILSPIELFFK